MESFLEDLLDDVASVGGGWLILAAFLLAFAETALFTDFVVPGEIGLVIVGAAAARGDDPHLALMIVAASIGATAGDSVGWAVGRYVGTGVIERWSWVRDRFGPQIERARAYFEARGGAAVFLGRFVGALRALVSVAAGTSGMPYGRFLPWNAAASVAWTGLVLSAGYVFGRNVRSVVSDVGLIVAGTIVTALVVWWLVRRWRGRE